MTNVKIFSDFGCPFCYITLGIVEKLREDKLDFNVEWIPYQIHPDAPIEGESISKIADSDQSKKMLEMLKGIAKPYDNVIYSDKMDTIYNTKRALLAGEYAKTIGRFEEFAKEAFQAAFLHNLNIGKKEVIDDLAKDLGFNVDEMNEAIDSGRFNKILEIVNDLAQDFDVKEVPTFLINNKETLVNVRNYDNIKEKILNAKE